MKNLSIDKQIVLFINEAIDKRVLLSILFGLFSIVFIVIGIYVPKIYESSSAILWTNYNPAQSILQQSVSAEEMRTSVRDQVEIAKQIIFSNHSLDRLIEEAQLNVADDGTQLNRKKIAVIKAGIKSNLKIDNSGSRLLTISYRHPDPDLVFLVVSIATELFLQESRDSKNETSQGAYDFINRQVIDYKNKLDDLNKRIIEFRKANVDLDSDTRVGVNTRVNNLKQTLRETKLLLTEARVRKSALIDQLNSEKRKVEKQQLSESRLALSAEKGSVLTERLATLQSDLDTLRLSYTDSYPDIIQLKEQIAKIEEQISIQNQARASQITEAGSPDVEINYNSSSLLVQLIQDVSNVETTIQTLIARTADAQSRLDNELERANKVNSLESQLAEMTRDLDVTQEIYNDLLTRRENARVSLNLQLENQGSAFKLQEPASRPVSPIGLRFFHFAIGSAPAAAIVTCGLLFAFLFLDARIRHEVSIDKDVLDIPVIGTIAHYSNDLDKMREKVRTVQSVSVVLSTLIIMAVLVILKINNFLGV